MRITTCILPLLAAISIAACTQPSICDQAAAHLEDCLGEAASATSECTGAQAESILEQSCEQLQQGQSAGKGDFLAFMCAHFGIFCPPEPDYEPCGDKTCGDLCTICDPKGPSCVETDIIKLCNADGICEASVPVCEAFDSCAGKSCGESCTICDPNDLDCFETAVLKSCSADGVCEASFPDCSAADCCEVADQPGFFGNASCFEGSTCCDDGSWACNDGAGKSTCAAESAACEFEDCAGFFGLGCADINSTCADNPFDDCDPQNGGADCSGICIAP